MENKKNKVAVALKYDKDDIAPSVVAKGKGYTADKIVDKAVENDVPIYENKEIVEDLYLLEIDQQIPEELYNVVAEIIAFVWSLDEEKRDKFEKQQ